MNKSMTANERILFCLIGLGLDVQKETPSEIESLFRTAPDWKQIYKTASQQGVLAVVYDGLNRLVEQGSIPERSQPSRTAKLQWGFNVVKIENCFLLQKALSEELARIYAGYGIRTVVLKGLAVAQYYPEPQHRPCGDLDCFLMGDFEKGNEIAQKAGGEVGDEGGYKHSHIRYKGLMVENHKYCTAIRNGRRAKDFERALQRVLQTESRTPIGESHLENPSPLFNALFLSVHAWNHFLNESISLRHICDWAMFVKTEGNRVAWAEFEKLTSAYDKGLSRFAHCMTFLANDLFGIEIPKDFTMAKDLKPLADRMMRSVLYEQETIYNKGYSAWKIRVKLVLNMLLRNNWKSRAFSEHSALYRTMHNIGAFFFDRNPHL